MTTAEEVRAIALLQDTRHGRLALSQNALPFVTLAWHIVVDRAVLLRVHRGFEYHRACDGNVVAYEADNLGEVEGQDVWSVQCVGVARCVEPTAEELARFGPLAASAADGEPFDPAYLRIDPQFVTVHWLTGTRAH